VGVKQEGLEKRVAFEARRISSQHRQLEAFHELVAQALAAGEPGGVLRAFMRFRDALEAHFAMEDEIFFPAMHGLRPELEVELTVLVQQHHAMRAQIAEIQALFDAEQLGDGGRVLDAMVGTLSQHEEREERLQAVVRGAG
jgi:iron-sulfur cluster repair protein YtfE (RIC family)